jgi:hypothetical protein
VKIHLRKLEVAKLYRSCAIAGVVLADLKLSAHISYTYHFVEYKLKKVQGSKSLFNPYPTAFPYGNGMVLHFYQQQESSTAKTVHKVINKGLTSL